MYYVLYLADEDVNLYDAKASPPVTLSENNTFNTQYSQISAGMNHPHMQKANSFGYGSYSSHAVNLNAVDNFSLPRRLPERPHSNPNLHETRIQTPSPKVDSMGLNLSESYTANAILHNSNPSIASQRSYSLRDDRTNRIHLPRRHLETVYETEDTVPSSSSSGSAPLLVRQKRVTSPFPYSGSSFHDESSPIYSFYPTAISPQLPLVKPVVTTHPSSSSMAVHSPDHKIANYEYML